jgi:hypothetical protein
LSGCYYVPYGYYPAYYPAAYSAYPPYPDTPVVGTAQAQREIPTVPADASGTAAAQAYGNYPTTTPQQYIVAAPPVVYAPYPAYYPSYPVYAPYPAYYGGWGYPYGYGYGGPSLSIGFGWWSGGGGGGGGGHGHHH